LIKDEILQLRDEGATIIFATHRMESVEELCDNIALIHESNKILDGKLIDIKRQYKSNIFEIGLLTDNKLETENYLKDKFQLSEATFKTINDELKFNIKMDNNGSANDLISHLTSQGELTHFVEVIPSVNDIFIQTVQNN